MLHRLLPVLMTALFSAELIAVEAKDQLPE